jgi:threonine/homoserine/homoserine lactone efflux protein
MSASVPNMLDPSVLAIVALASLALAIVPGPAVIYIVTRSVSQGRAAGVVSVAGIHVGTLVHVIAAALGLSALLMRSVVAFSVVKYAGAAYLILLGIRTLRQKEEESGRLVLGEQSLRKVFNQGIVVNVLNPKTALFFFAFLPQFVDSGNGKEALQMLLLGFVFIAVAFVSDAVYALVSSGLSDRLRSSSRFTRRQKFLSGGVYLALGVSTALSGNRR